jgi:hypothetical protein
MHFGWHDTAEGGPLADLQRMSDEHKTWALIDNGVHYERTSKHSRQNLWR